MSSNHRAHCVWNRARQAAGIGDGGASRDRTDDPLVANQVLSQLSYGPSPIRNQQLVLERMFVANRALFGGSGRSCTPDLTLIRGAL